MIKKCSVCKKEIGDDEISYAFTTKRCDTSTSSKRIHYGRFCQWCFFELSLEEDN